MQFVANKVKDVIANVGNVRNYISDLLAKYAGYNDTVSKSSITKILRDLDGAEKLMRDYGNESLSKAVRDSVDFTLNGNNVAFKESFGSPLISSGKSDVKDEVTDYIITRIETDGLTLSDRIWNVSGVIRDAIATQLRADIIKGNSVSAMIKNVRNIYDNETWMIKRLVVTEMNTACRMTTAKSVERSKVADWVRIVENGERHPNHKRHECYLLAREDRYGQGAGVFKPTDDEIYSPHPQCSSFLVPVLKAEYL